MEKNKKAICLILTFFLVWCSISRGAWDKDKPASTTSLRNSNPQILANFSALETAVGQDHEFSTGGTNSGEHLQIKFNAPISTPTNAVNKGWLYGKDVSSVIEFHWLDESGNELQMTSGGDLYSSAGLTITTNATFNGGITLGAGDDLIGSATSDITMNTNKFTVAGATGNTVVAGTFTSTGVATLGDSSQMTTSTAPTADADLSNKKYVDDQNISHAAQIKAWVNFDGTDGDPDSTKTGYNITSITDNGTGDYTINWATDFATTAYAVVGSSNQAHTAMTTLAAGSVRILTTNSAFAAFDATNISIIAIGTQ